MGRLTTFFFAVFMSTAVSANATTLKAPHLMQGCYSGLIRNRSDKSSTPRTVCIRRQAGNFLATNKNGYTYRLSYVSPSVGRSSGSFRGHRVGGLPTDGLVCPAFPEVCSTGYALEVIPFKQGLSYIQTIQSTCCDADPGTSLEVFRGFLRPRR